MGYRSGSSAQDDRLAEPADLEAVQVEPADHAPRPLSGLGEELACQAAVGPLPEPLPSEELQKEEKEESVVERVLEQREEAEGTAVTAARYAPGEREVEEQGPAEEEGTVCPPAKSPVCEAASCPALLSTEELERPEAVITLEEEAADEAEVDSQLEHAQRVNMPGEQEPELPTVIELDPASPETAEPRPPSLEETKGSEQQHQKQTNSGDAPVDYVCLSASTSAPSPSQATVAAPHKPLVPCYWSLELLIAAAFCTDVPPFPLFPLGTPPVAPSQPSPHHGMELLSELADLELQQLKHNCGKSQGEGTSGGVFPYSYIYTHNNPKCSGSLFYPSSLSTEAISHSLLGPGLRHYALPP